LISQDPYDTLTERLGFPGSTRLRSILQMLMSPEQARMAEALPGSVAEVVEKTGSTGDEVSAALDELYFKGVVYPRGDFANREYYRFARNIIQLHDAVQASRDLDPVRDRPHFQQWHEFCKEEMYPRLGAIFKAATARSSRVGPAEKSIEGLSALPGRTTRSSGAGSHRRRPLLLRFRPLPWASTVSTPPKRRRGTASSSAAAPSTSSIASPAGN
jgi:hypothetical protein